MSSVFCCHLRSRFHLCTSKRRPSARLHCRFTQTTEPCVFFCFLFSCWCAIAVLTSLLFQLLMYIELGLVAVLLVDNVLRFYHMAFAYDGTPKRLRPIIWEYL